MAWLLSIVLVAPVRVDGGGDCVDAGAVRARLTALLVESGDSLLVGVEVSAGAGGNHEVALRVTESGQELLARSYDVAPGDCGGVADLLELVLRQFLRDLPTSRVPVGEPPPPLRSPSARSAQTDPSPSSRRSATTFTYSPWESEPPEVGVRAAVLAGPLVGGSGGWGGGAEICGVLALGPEGDKLVITASQRLVAWEGEAVGVSLFGVGWHFFTEVVRGGLEVRTGLRVRGTAVTGRTELLAWLALPVGPVALGPLVVLATPKRGYLPNLRPAHEPPVLLFGLAGTLEVWEKIK